jgi:DNA-binding MarR family transcriptional regulator
MSRTILAYMLRNRDMDEISLRDVQDHLMLAHSTVSGIIRRLEENGFLIRKKGNSDARRKCLELTRKGLEFRNVLEKMATDNEDVLLTGMSGEEKAEFYRLLVISLKNMNQ